MTPKAKQRAIRRAFKRYRALLGLNGWRFDLEWASPKDSDEAAAGCIADPEYRRARLFFNVSKIPDDELDEHVRHELLHAVVWPLAHVAEFQADSDDESATEMIRLAHERVVTDLEYAPFWSKLE